MYREVAVLVLLAILAAVPAALPTKSLDVGDTLIYQVDMTMKASGIGIEDINMRVWGTVKITILNISEDYITMRVEPNLQVEGVPPEYANITGDMNKVQTITVPAYGMIGPLSEEGGAGLNDLVSMLREQLEMLGFNETKVEVSEVMYNGVPAIKLKIDLKATNYMGMGTNVEIHATSYMDMATLALLYGEASAKYAANTGGFEFSYEIGLTNPEVLQQSLAGYEVEVEGGNKLSLVFAGEGLTVSEPRIDNEKVTFTVAGKGIGSVIIKAPPGTEPRVYVDGEEVGKYKITTAPDGSTYYKVPIKFSEHRVDVFFGKPVIRASELSLNLPTEGGGLGPAAGIPYTTLIIIAVIIAAAAAAAAVALRMAKKGQEAVSPAPAAPPETPPSPPPPST